MPPVANTQMRRFIVYLLATTIVMGIISCGGSGSFDTAPSLKSSNSDAPQYLGGGTFDEENSREGMSPSVIFLSSQASDDDLRNFSAEGTLTEESTIINEITTAPIQYIAEENSFYLRDTKRQFYVGTFNGKEEEGENFEPVLSSGNTVFGDTEEEEKQEPYKGFYLLKEIADIHDWFFRNFGIGTSGEKMFIGYNSGTGLGVNASGGGAGDKTYSLIYIGKNVRFPCRDILAHEYTHTIQYNRHLPARGEYAPSKDSVYKANNEANAISEGLADVFSCFYTGKWDVDLTPLGRGEGHRNAANPSGDSMSNIHDVDGEDDEQNNSYDYKYATCISHAAFLMSESKAFTTQALQTLWFDTMIALPQNCHYTDLRSCMENVAINSKMSDKQMQAISNAFDAVGISYYEKAKKYNGDISLTVYDQKGNVYDDYKVRVYRLDKNSSSQGNADTYSTTLHKTLSQNKAEPLQLHLDEGTYRIVITDNAPSQKTDTYTITVDPSSSKKQLYSESFGGAAFTVAPNAKLTVLNVDGEPITDYSASAKVENNYSKVIKGRIDLPEKNYYTIHLSHMEGGTAVMNQFTVRVKNGAADAMVFQSTFKGGYIESPETDDFNGLWVTFSSIGTLYYFDNGEVTCYTKTDITAPLNDRHYHKEWTQKYTIEKMTSAEGPGQKVVLDNGAELWLLDNSPDVIDYYFHDTNGDLTLSGSSSLMRVTDFTVDDLILDEAAQNPYADIIRQYGRDYGRLTFVKASGFEYYKGVFLAKLIDFDQDGSDEMLVGYSAPRKGIEQFMPEPKLDVWTMKNGVPVQVYEGAIVHHGDIGSHCAYVDLDGKCCLCSGYSGYDTELSLLSFENGSFTEYLNLEYDGDRTYMINGQNADEKKWNELYQKIENNPEERFHSGCVNATGHESKEVLKKAISEDYKLLGM